jgi:guanylate kinase
VDYYFLSLEDFRQKIREGAFVEWEMVYEGKYYGTLRTELQRIWDNNQIPLLDIDVKGAIHVQQQFPQTSLSIFIEPPSVGELKRRLESRGTETPESLRDRVNKAAYEISFKHHFDHCIVNDNLDRACQQAEEIVVAFMNKK